MRQTSVGHAFRPHRYAAVRYAAVIASLALAGTCCATAARAEVILSNFEAPRGTVTTGINQLFHKAVGITLVGGVSYEFTSLEAPIRNLTTTPFTATGTIRANDGGNPGAVLATLSSQVLPGAGPTSTFVDYTFTGSYTLLAGQTYWFVLETDRPAQGNEVAWASPTPSVAPTGAVGIVYAGYRTGAISAGVTTWSDSQVLNSVRLSANAVAVPEPGTLGLLALGTLALAAGTATASRRRKPAAA